MKIICFLFDPHVGGPTIRARAVYERMMADGYEVRVAIPAGEGSAQHYLEEKAVAVDRLAINKPVPPSNLWAFAKFALLSPLNVLRVARYLRSQKPDVVHVNGAFDLVPAFGAKLAFVPLVWHLNDTVFNPVFSRALGFIVALLANQIAIASQRVGQHYGVSGTKVRTLFAPVDVDRFKPGPTPAALPQTPHIGLLANWNWIKGQDRFVEVIRQLKFRGHTVKGTIIGRFVERQRSFWEPILQDIESQGLADTIETPGFVEEVHREITRMDLVLLTSHSEACPLCVLEAMSVGIPLVVFDVGGVREMMGVEEGEDAGIVVAEGNISQMVEAIEKLLGDRELYEQCGRNGRRRAVERFSVPSCVERHIGIYNAALAR